MANFVDVMKQYDRMLKAHKKGVSIPIEASYETAVKQPDFFEKCVMEWAAEYPEPVYPTWREWLLANRIIGDADSDYAAGLLMRCKRIPADIAEKLGIEPKEGEHEQTR